MGDANGAPPPAWYGDAHREVTTSEGVRITYLEQGEGEPVLLLHGYPQSHLTWRRLVAPLARTHRVLAPDWGGWGRSERRLDLSYDYESEVRRLADLVGVLGLERYNLFAHDYGGYLALGLLRDHPEQVLRLGILNSRAHRTFPAPRRWLFGLVERLARLRIGGLIRWLPLGWMHRAALRRELPSTAREPGVLEAYTRWMDHPAGRRWLVRFFAGYSTALRPDLVATLPAVRCPTAVIWGERDAWCPVAIAEELAAGIEPAVLTRLPAVGHFVLEEDAPGVLRALEALLAEPLREPA